MKDSSTLSITGDNIVLLLPFLEILNLRANLRTKIKIGLLFLFGVLILVISILRYVAVARQDFESLDFAILSQDALAYAVIEANMGILCANIPMVYDLFTAWKAKFSHHANAATDSLREDPHLDNNGLGNVVSDPPIPLEDRRHTYARSVSSGGAVLSYT
ncbi:hypothetical protein F5Y05DRAFT_415576 [Hypoxylon sp. FL0543]|nr:hypothetical protein F5Y05DRAFT_415576 [Hypoxylon sp. FL0543]